MPSYTRMKRIFLEGKIALRRAVGWVGCNHIGGQARKIMINLHTGLLWLFLLHYGLMAMSLEPGFLDFDNLPDTNFSCVGKVIGGYYADLETNCQMFHVCTIGQADEPMDIRFLCLNGTVFDQETRVCERIDEVDCSKSEKFYSLNLELYGNTGPILEETPEVPQETEPPSLIIKSTSSTTTTTTTTRPHYYTTIRPSTATTSINKPSQAGHHFPVNNPDIRFNPEEINISLNPGAPPDIRTKHYQPHPSFSDSDKRLVPDDVDNEEEQSVRVQKPDRGHAHVGSSTSPNYRIIEASDVSDNDNFRFPDDFSVTELPPRQQQFLIQTNSFRHSQSFPPNVNRHNSNQYHRPQFHSTTVKQQTNFHQNPSHHTTVRTVYLPSLTPPQPEVHQHHHYTHHPRTEKTPQRVQIPIPLLPTLPPLTFSSPAPFSLQRHIETKRYTKDHQAPPRIIISASASVSDASGRRLNYSLGTIGAAHILESPPPSYDDYKDGDVGLDPFYHDVPRVKQSRRRKRRSAAQTKQINPFDIIKNEKEAVDVLKFLFTWYQSHQATATVPSVTSPVSPELIKKINYELAPPAIDDESLKTDSSEIQFTSSSKEPSSSTESGYETSELFRKNSRFSILGGYRNENSKHPLGAESAIIVHSGSPEFFEDVDSSSGSKDVKNSTLRTQANKATEFKEKMDNGDTITILKDTKESSINPDDYVDDNYEGIVFKENVTTENVEAKLPDAKEVEPLFDPAAIAELYEYFNLNKGQFATTATPSLHTQTNQTDHLVIKKDEPKEDTDSSSNLSRHTEINVLSEVHEDDGSLRSSSITSKTTATPPKHTARRRGQSRQKPTGSYHEEQNAWKNNRRGRSRGRSRFNSPSNIYSSTTPVSSSVTPGSVVEETYPVTPEISTMTATVLPHEVTETGVIHEETEATHDYADKSIAAGNDNKNDVAKNATTSEFTTVNANADEIEKSATTIEAIIEQSTLSTPPPAQNVTTEYIHTKTVEDNEITNGPIDITTEATAQSLSRDTITIQEGASGSGNSTAVSDDPSYLIKLLKYYAEDAMNMHHPVVVTTELPEASYDPLTENQLTSTTPYEPKRNRQRGKHRHSSRVSTSTELPTLRDIYEDISKPAIKENVEVKTTNIPNEELEEDRHIKSKADLLEKLSLIEQNLAVKLITVTEQPSISDTTITTPLVSFEELESFGTTFSSATEPTKFDEYSTASKELTQMFEVSTESTTNKSYDSFYDDLFVVPELTERSSSNQSEPSTSEFTIEVPETTTSMDFTHNLGASLSTIIVEDVTEPMKTPEAVEELQEVTTVQPDVEIQKSISLPISFLDFDVPSDVNNAHNINGLISESVRGEENSSSTVSDIPNSTTNEGVTDHDDGKYTFRVAENESSTTSKYVGEEHLRNLHNGEMPEVHQNSTEIIFVKNTEADEEALLNYSRPVGSPGMVNSSRLLQVVIETATDQPVTTTTTFTTSVSTSTTTTSTSRPYHTRKTRPPRRRPYHNPRNQFGRHRFSTELLTTKPTITEQQQNQNPYKENITDAPLHRSATPTKSELKKVLLHTTPLSSKNAHRSPTKVSKHYVFNCFGKETNRFYVDPRDCRLFHYCTQGYSKNQLLDLKYVCDQKTFFDEEKLICTKVKPARCL